MLAYRFQSEISDSGIVKLPEEILNQLNDRFVEIIILEPEEKNKASFDSIKALRGKYNTYLGLQFPLFKPRMSRSLAPCGRLLPRRRGQAPKLR